MIANLLTVPIGLWLAYGAIFASVPKGASNANIGICGAAIVILAAWARFGAGAMSWQTNANTALGAILILYAAARTYLPDVGFDPFWLTLLAGTSAAILALWSALYRPASATT